MSFLEQAVLKDALSDINCLGVPVLVPTLPNTQPYAVVSGRSNARWWLVPLANRRVAASGFALFQPQLVSARIIKWVVCILSLLGLSRLWVRSKVYLSGASSLDAYFPNIKQPVYAYFIPAPTARTARQRYRLWTQRVALRVSLN